MVISKSCSICRIFSSISLQFAFTWFIKNNCSNGTFSGSFCWECNIKVCIWWKCFTLIYIGLSPSIECNIIQQTCSNFFLYISYLPYLASVAINSIELCSAIECSLNNNTCKILLKHVSQVCCILETISCKFSISRINSRQSCMLTANSSETTNTCSVIIIVITPINSIKSACNGCSAYETIIGWTSCLISFPCSKVFNITNQLVGLVCIVKSPSVNCISKPWSVCNSTIGIILYSYLSLSSFNIDCCCRLSICLGLCLKDFASVDSNKRFYNICTCRIYSTTLCVSHNGIWHQQTIIVPAVVCTDSCFDSIIKFWKTFTCSSSSVNIQYTTFCNRKESIIVENYQSLNITRHAVNLLSNLSCCCDVVSCSAFRREVQIHVVGTVHYVINKQNKSSILYLILCRCAVVEIIVGTCTRLRRELNGKVDITLTLIIPLWLSAIVNAIFAWTSPQHQRCQCEGK